MRKTLFLLFLLTLPFASAQFDYWETRQINTEEGTYSVTADLYGKGKVQVLLDGEKYFDPVFLRGSKTTSRQNFYLEGGPHTVIFLFNNENIELNNLQINKTTGKYADTRKEAIITEYGRIFEIGDMFTGSYINVNIARDYALFSDNKHQYVTYYDSEGYLVLGRRQLNKTYFEKYFLPAEPAPKFSDSTEYYLSDPHYFISANKDGSGNIHVAYGHHGDELHYFVSNEENLTKWSTNNIINVTSGDKITYPRFHRLNDGNLVMFYRNQDEEGPIITLLEYDIKERKWSKVHETLITANGKANAYLWRPVVVNNTIHLAWTWRMYEFEELPKEVFFKGFSNKNIMYAKSIDGGEIWLNSENEQYKLPINMSNAEVIHKVEIGQDMFNHFGSDYDDKGKPHFSFTKQDEQGIAQQWHLYQNGNNWLVSQVTNYKEDFEWKRWQQGGQASTHVVRPTILVDENNNAIVISRTEENNNEIEFYLSPENNWKKIVVFNESVGGWEPQADMDLWHRSKEINLLLAGITDKTVVERNKIAESKIDRLKAVIYRTLKQLRMWKLYVKLIKGQDIGASDYYSADLSVEEKEISTKLKENTGYIYEINHKNFKDE